MPERRITFLDAEDQPVVVKLRENCVELVVSDSHPQLEANELRGFATALFAAYLGGPLAKRLQTARDRIDGVRDQLIATGAHDLAAALDRAVLAVADVADAMTAATAAVGPLDDPSQPAKPEPELPGIKNWRKKPPRPSRVGDGDELFGWGWVRSGDRRVA